MALDGFLELKRGGVAAVEGECRDRTFAVKKAMEITSFEFGAETSSGSSTTDLDESDDDEEPKKKSGQKKKPPADPMGFTFKISKEVDSATPQLFRAYCEHAAGKPKPFDTAVVTLRKAGGKEPQVFMVLEFGEVLVCSFSINAGSANSLPEEKVEFTFKKYVRYRYQPQTGDGHGAANIKGWSKTKNEPL
jgi:type VI protein secretion system component Hcp